MMRPPTRSTVFPYTTLFRSRRSSGSQWVMEASWLVFPAGTTCRPSSNCPRSMSTEQRVKLLRPTSIRSEEHTSELQSRVDLVCRLLLEKKKEYNCHAIYHMF